MRRTIVAIKGGIAILFFVYSNNSQHMDRYDYLLEGYDYRLPEESIAQEPSHPAHHAKLMICKRGAKQGYEESSFATLPEELSEKHLLFFNKTKVFKARIPLKNIRIIKKNGTACLLEEGEIFIYRIHDAHHFECLVSDGKHFRPGSQIFLTNDSVLISKAFTENGILFELSKGAIFEILEEFGEMPLPPYISYEKRKEEWYQTFFAEDYGSAAAPTASLHFTPELVKQLEDRNIGMQYHCLHVGLGTFKPVFEENIRKHLIHEEPMSVPHALWSQIKKEKESGKIFTPVGTTMVRFLESLPYLWKAFNEEQKTQLALDSATKAWWNELSKDISEEKVQQFIKRESILCNEQETLMQTRLFIVPWFTFLLVDEMITNFHLPKSSLLMLVAAFLGRKKLLTSYQEAIEKGYQFYSFGDGMWVR